MKTASLTAAQMAARARRIKRRQGLDLIVIDYLQLMIQVSKGENMAQEVSKVTRSLKLMARELKCPVIALSQLNRDVEKRPNKRPLMSDLRESGSIEQDADVILMLYRDEYYDEASSWKGYAEANIVKQRMGETGTVTLAFDGKHIIGLRAMREGKAPYDFQAETDKLFRLDDLKSRRAA